MTKHKVIFALILGLVISCNSLGQTTPISIPLVNQGFEAQDVTGGAPINDPPGCGTVQQGQITGWIAEHVIDGSSFGVAHWTCDDGAPPSNVASIGYGARMYQLTGERARPGVYVLQLDVANWFYPYPGDWKAELYQGISDASGNVTLSSAPFCSDSGWAMGDMKRVTVTCPLTNYLLNVTSPDPLTVAGQNPGGYVAIFFQNGVKNPALGNHSGWPILIDNVSLTFTPTN